MNRRKCKSICKKCISCIMTVFLVVLLCDNGWGYYGYYTVGKLRYIPIDMDNKLVEVGSFDMSAWGIYPPNDDNANSGNAGDVYIPSTIQYDNLGTFYVTRIGRRAMGGMSCTSVTIAEGIKEIEENGLEHCQSLNTISLPESLEIIGDSAFWGCGVVNNNMEIDIKEGVKKIGERAFSYSGLKEIKIPLSVKELGQYVFDGCKYLEKVMVYENGITKFPKRTFYGCEKLTEMRIAIDEKKPVKPIFVDKNDEVFENTPDNRNIVFVNEEGEELKGSSLVAAQKAYKAVDDGDTTDDKWFGWEIGNTEGFYTINIDVEKNGEKWENHEKQFLLKNDKGDLMYHLLAENGIYTVCVKIGENVIDTGVTVEVKDSDTSVTLEYFTVTFYDDDTAYGNDTVWGQQIVRKGDYAVKLNSDPEKADFKFAGWKTDKEGSRAFDFGAEINDTTNIYASWSKASEEPSKPSETEKPTETNKPTDTEKPSDTNKPTDTEKPSDTNKPTDTENPSDINKPTDTEKPSDTNKPTDTEKPTAPSNPADTETTTASGNTAGSETPSTPSPSLKPNGSPEIEEPEASVPNGEAEKGEKPKTGDTNRVEIYATAAMIAGLSYVMLIFARGREGMTEEEKNIRVSALIEWSRKGSRLRKYAAIAAIFFLLLYYHSIGKRVDLEWEEICR